MKKYKKNKKKISRKKKQKKIRAHNCDSPPGIAPRNCTLINSSFGTLYRPPILDPPIRAPKNSPNSGRSKWPPKRDPTQKHPQNVHPPIRDPQKPPEYTHDSKQNTKHSVWDSKYTPQYIHPVGHFCGGYKMDPPIRSWDSIMDTYNDTKNAEYKTPQYKTSKVAFLFFLRELKKTTKSSSMIVIHPINIIHNTTHDHHRSHHHHHQSYHDPKKKFHPPINQSIIIRKKNSSHHTKNSSNHQGYTDQKKLMKTSKFIKNMKIIKTMKTPQMRDPLYPPKLDPPTPHRSPG